VRFFLCVVAVLPPAEVLGDLLHQHVIFSFPVGCVGAHARIVITFGTMCFVPRLVVDVLSCCLLAFMCCFPVLRNFQLLVSLFCSSCVPPQSTPFAWRHVSLVGVEKASTTTGKTNGLQ